MRKRILNSEVCTHLLLIGLAFTLGIYVFMDFFRFSLWGDDWMLMFYILEHKIAGIPEKIFFWEYGGQAVLMEIIRSAVGFNSKYYYYISYLLRFVASTSIYFLTFYLIKNKFFAFLSTLLFLISFAGIESTDWVHNSVNYMSLALMAFGFIYFFEHLKSGKLFTRNMLLAYLFFVTSYILATVRMHGLVFLYPLTEIVFLITKKSKPKYAVIRSIILIATLLILMKMGLFGNAGTEILGRFNNSFLSYLNQSSGNMYKALVYPFGSFFNSLFPFYVYESHPLFSSFLLGLQFKHVDILLWFLPVFIIISISYIKIKRGFWLFFTSASSWLVFLIFISKAFKFGLDLKGAETILGGLTFVMLCCLSVITYYKTDKITWARLSFLILWPVAFLLVPHALITTHSTIESFSRYMTLPAGGSQILIIYVFYTLLLVIKSNKKYKVVLFILVISYIYLVISNLRGIELFFEKSTYRYSERVEPTWYSLKQVSSDISYKQRIRIFVFDYDSLNAYQTMIGFGGWYRYAFENDIKDRKQIPIFIGIHEADQITEAVRDPNYGRRIWGSNMTDGIRIEDIYGFVLKGSSVVRNDSFIREKLKTHFF